MDANYKTKGPFSETLAKDYIFISEWKIQKTLQFDEQLLISWSNYYLFMPRRCRWNFKCVIFKHSSVISFLTYWGRIYASVIYAIIGSDNGLSPARHQAVIWTNTSKVSIRPEGTYFSEIVFKIQKFSFKEMPLETSSAPTLSWPKCVNTFPFSVVYMRHWTWSSLC